MFSVSRRVLHLRRTLSRINYINKTENILFITKQYNSSKLNTNSTNLNSKAKKYGLLIAGSPPDELVPNFGDYGVMITNLLTINNNFNHIYEKYYCYLNRFPNEKQLNELDGVIISGSRYDAHDITTPWIQKLRKLCVNLINYNDKIDNKQQKKIIGICFGHQLLSNLIKDGHSGRAPDKIGWELGLRNVIFNDNFKKSFPNINYSNLNILQSHQDQVLKLPSQCTLLAKSMNTPIEMYCYKDYMLCIQGHPEFTIDYVKQLLETRKKNRVISDDDYKKAIATLETDVPHVKEWSNLIHNWLQY